jgi:hypothetical protein
MQMKKYLFLLFKKSTFCRSNHILIDDMEKNTVAWEAAGGIAILHKLMLLQNTLIEEYNLKNINL